MDRHQLLMERESEKLLENASIRCGDLKAAFEALKRIERIDQELAKLKEGAAAEQGSVER